MANLVTETVGDGGQHSQEIASVAEVRRQGDGDQEHGETGENEVAGAHKEKENRDGRWDTHRNHSFFQAHLNL